MKIPEEIKETNIFQKWAPKCSVDPEPITPVANSFITQDGDIQQWGSFVKKMSLKRAISDRKKPKMMFMNDAENISISSNEEPNLIDDPLSKIEVDIKAITN